MSPRRITLFALVSYVVLAVFQTWPLSLHLSTHLSGPPGGDGGAYVWNLWVFSHELIENGRSPFSTSMVIALDPPANLALDNYTVFANLAAMPLLPWLGVVPTFNVVYILNCALCGFGLFLLAERLTGRALESWIAGAMFLIAPFFVARGTSHYSLAAAAPLPLFLYWLHRAWESGRTRDAVLTGVMMAWAAFSDPYYGVYCALLGAIFAADKWLIVTPADRRGSARTVSLLNAAIGALIVAIVVVHVIAGGTVTVGPLSLAMRSLYTPMLLLTTLVFLRLALTSHTRLSLARPSSSQLRLIAIGGLTTAILLIPEVLAIAELAARGGVKGAPVPWRSSAPGVDLASFFVPSPVHPLAPPSLVAWLSRQPGQFDENVMSLSGTAIAVIFLAWRHSGYRSARLWWLITLGFLSLAVGPFLRVAGISTYIPTPWTLLRYVPLIGEARMPQRFGVLVLLGFCVITAGALVALSARFPARRRAMLSAVIAGLLVEWLAVPRTLYSAAISPIYTTIAADTRPVRVLDVPLGLRDGLSSLGDASATSQFVQTVHGKPIVGGYLSRISERTKQLYLSKPVLRAVLELSEGRQPSAETLAEAAATAGPFLDESQIGYAVVDAGRASPALQEFVAKTLGLRRVAQDGHLELWAR